MKLYNRELEEIENQERQDRIESIVQRQIEFLVQNYGIDEKMLQDKAEGLAVVERRSSDATYFAEYKGEKKELPNNRSAAAFVTMKKQEYDGDKWSFENGVYMSDANSEHKIIHELFHFFSQKQQMGFDEKGVGYAKSGVSISGYDREDNVVDSSLDADGLNEGITELLATRVDTGSKPEAYDFQTSIANILISNEHNSLLKAYFSDDEKDFQKFLEEFDKQQKTVSSKKLIEMSTYGQIVVDTEFLKGCLEYALSFCKDMEELKAERKRLLPIFRDMSNNLNIGFDIEQFDLKQFFDDILMQKRAEIMALSQTDSQALLDSAIEATEGTTRVETMNTQAGTLKELAKGKDEQVKETEIG